MNEIIIFGNGYEWCEKSLQGMKCKDGVCFTNDRIPVHKLQINHVDKFLLRNIVRKITPNCLRIPTYKKIIDNVGKNDKNQVKYCLFLMEIGWEMTPGSLSICAKNFLLFRLPMCLQIL